jgi:preprotein translocase subunit YajC
MEKYSQWVFIVAIIAAFYFLIIRPQKKRQQDQADLMGRLVPGAEIMTIGGLYATIVSIDDDRVRVVVADGTEMVFAMKAIARTVKPVVDDADEPGELDESADVHADAEDHDAVGLDDSAPDDAGDDAKPATNPESADV